MSSNTIRSTTARLPLEHPHSMLAGLLNFWTRRQYGQQMEPMIALLHHRKVMTSVARFEMGVAKWSTLDSGLKELACLSVASQIGCSWCMDFGYYLARTNGMDLAKLEQVVSWRSSAVYTPLERKVLEYAEAMTATPPEVTDEMVEGLRADLDDAQLVELTEMISVENLRSRTNSALGLTSQGFKSQCDLPPQRAGKTRPWGASDDQ